MVTTSASIGVIGAGTMGAGIAQVAASAGCRTLVFDNAPGAAERLKTQIASSIERLTAKGKLEASEGSAILGRIAIAESLRDLGGCGLLIEAIIEDLGAKQSLFRELEQSAAPDAILATNTSSLPVTALAEACKHPARVLGLHFFNPAPLMPLVEVVPTPHTDERFLTSAVELLRAWRKTPVIAKDTPGFIVNRIARPFYGEALKILEDELAQPAEIDWAMRELAGFRMGPFELMDLIGIDVNYAVTESVFRAFNFNPRYRPSVIQKKMVEAGHLGRKSGRGFYDYSESAERPAPAIARGSGEAIVSRILAMIINEAVDALDAKVASEADIDLAMIKGANYPKGPLAWLKEIGPGTVLETLERLQQSTGDERYRPGRLLREMAEGPARA